MTSSWGKLHESRVIHVIKAILDVESNGNGNFKIWPNGQVKKGHKGSIFKLKILKIKHIFLIQFHLRNPVVWFVFVYDVYRWPKNVVKFYDVTTFHT